MVIRESHNGIHYYADEGAERLTYKSKLYNLKFWRHSKLRADQLASVEKANGYYAIVRKIKFHKGGMFENKKDLPHVLNLYGVYTRKCKKE